MNPGTRLPLVVAAVVVVAVIAGTFILRRGEAPGPADVPQSTAAAAADPVAQAPAPANRNARPARASGESLEQQVATQLDRRVESRAQHAARTRELREQSAARYASEQVDPAWAPQKESQLTGIASNEAFAQAGAKPTSLSVDCRSSMCRVDGAFETRSQAEDWVMMYMSSVGGTMPNSIVSRTQAEDGSTRVEIYGRAR
ncbi:hypothetical protein [Luteimonas sp. MC1895]|uniref:hypothetical protein n=1 Tax=Luteimonas sp. MC1895 TaxID=2819513 RepID=UPI0018F0B3CB|nr:hypothetical protein [Luteimonas sp. MC1895]MBJ6977906.1 hypothetical protein [Luteimonas sp. MC1895]